MPTAETPRCTLCGRPMEPRRLRSSSRYWRCVELCTVREDGPDGAYYVGPDTWRTGYFWPDRAIDEALREAAENA